MTFSDSPTLAFHLDRYDNRVDMLDAIDRVSYSRQTTNTAAALEFLHETMFTAAHGDRPTYRNLAVLVTDGESNQKDATLEQAILAKSKAIHVITVGIGSWLDMEELQNMASYYYQDNVLHVERFSALPSIIDQIRDLTCDNRNECDSNPCANGGQCRNGFFRFECHNCFFPFTGKTCRDTCRNAADVVFAIDASGSIGKDNFRRTLNFVADIVQGFDVSGASDQSGVRVGFVTFSNDALLQFHLNQYSDKQGVLDAISVRYTGGTTNIAAALRYVRTDMFQSRNGDRSGVANYVILMTDGRADDSSAAWDEAIAARQQGINILTVGIGGGVDRAELAGLSSEPVNRNVIIAADFQALTEQIRTQVVSATCNNEDACLSNPCRNSGRCVDTMNGFTCTNCPNGYSGKLCERACDGKIDVTFVLDSSGSIRIERFPDVKNFLANITQQLDISPDKTQVGMVYWSDSAFVHFDLNRYHTRQDVVQAIRATPFLGGRTNTASALLLLREAVFTPARGDRDDANNIAIIVSDGNSNINQEDTIPEAIEDRVFGIHIMSVAVGKKFTNMLEIEAMTSLPIESNVFNVESYSGLQDIVQFIVDGTCDDVNECMSDPCLNGGRCVNGLKRYFCICRTGNTGYNCDRRCSSQLDVVFVLDISGSVEEEYRMVMSFAKAITYGLDMTTDRTRIGAVTYSTNTNGMFFLSSYISNKEGVINALNFFHKGGRTNTQESLFEMRTELFTTFRGDRSLVQNVAILVTDGYSNVNEQNTIAEALRAKDEGIQMYAVAIGENPNMGELNEIASDPESEFVFRLRSALEVDSVADDVLRQLCQ